MNEGIRLNLARRCDEERSQITISSEMLALADSICYVVSIFIVAKGDESNGSETKSVCVATACCHVLTLCVLRRRVVTC